MAYNFKSKSKLIRLFEGGHPLVYYQTYIILVPSIHNTCKVQMPAITQL